MALNPSNSSNLKQLALMGLTIYSFNQLVRTITAEIARYRALAVVKVTSQVNGTPHFREPATQN